jgi:sialate O-acetylesterase
MRISHQLVSCAFVLLLTSAVFAAAITPNGLFQDNMVLQQGRKLPVWGTAPAGDHLTVQFAGQTVTADADTQGRWSTELQPVRASAEPAQLVISDGKQTITLKNVLVGEVWLCSGQSNMEMRVRDILNAPAELQAATYPAIRHFEVGRVTAPAPLPNVKGRWDVCAPATAGTFTAAGYFFARELWNRLHVPVGLINASVGATIIQPWTPLASLAGVPAYREQYQRFQDDLTAYAADKAAYTARVKQEAQEVKEAQKAWNAQRVATDVGQREQWFAPAYDTTGWGMITLPCPSADLAWNYAGSVWVRRAVSIPPAWIAKPLALRLAACDDVDTTYVNGREVGRTWQDVPNFWKVPRNYVVPAELVTTTTVTIAVQIPNSYGVGGMIGAPAEMSLALAGDAGAAISLAGPWQVRLGTPAKVATLPKALHSGMPGYGGGDPAAFYHGMIAPLQPFAFKGVLWYQGESNAAEPALYADLFPALIAGWRAAWRMGDFPFYFVQLAQHQARQRLPIELESWGDLRDAQMAALSLPNTGMAVASDIGDAADIHPKNKQEVGRRLALIALARDYGQRVVYQGPTLQAQRRRGRALVLTFAHADGLRTTAGEITGFAIAGADGRFHAAQATLSRKTITVTAADGQVPVPVAVRYNWAINPAGTLVNAAGLPASQFRTDTWDYDEVATVTDDFSTSGRQLP